MKQFGIRLALAIGLCCLVGCGKEAETEAMPEKQVQIAENPILDPAVGQEAIEDMEEEIALRVKESIYEVRRGDLLGSASAISEYDSVYLFVTAAHVLAKDSEPAYLMTEEGNALPVLGIECFEEYDVAFLTVAKDAFGENKPTVADISEPAYEALLPGDAVFAWGVDGVNSHKLYSQGEILQKLAYVEDFGMPMLYARLYVEPGMSGGGGFDREGHYLGCIAGRNEEETVLVALPDILYLEQSDRLSYLKY